MMWHTSAVASFLPSGKCWSSKEPKAHGFRCEVSLCSEVAHVLRTHLGHLAFPTRLVCFCSRPAIPTISTFKACRRRTSEEEQRRTGEVRERFGTAFAECWSWCSWRVTLWWKRWTQSWTVCCSSSHLEQVLSGFDHRLKKHRDKHTTYAAPWRYQVHVNSGQTVFLQTGGLAHKIAH